MSDVVQGLLFSCCPVVVLDARSRHLETSHDVNSVATLLSAHRVLCSRCGYAVGYIYSLCIHYSFTVFT